MYGDVNVLPSTQAFVLYGSTLQLLSLCSQFSAVPLNPMLPPCHTSPHRS